MPSKRRTEISLLNVLFCFLVIFIHIVSYAVLDFPVGTAKYTVAMIPWRLATFVVQGFVFLAGVKLFLTGKENVPYWKYILGRFKGVVIPYVICFIAYYNYFVTTHDYPVGDAKFMLDHLLYGSLAFHLYFIPIIVQFDLLRPLWKFVVNKCSAIVIIPFTLLLSAMFETALPTMLEIIFPNIGEIYNDRIFTTYLAFWLIGCYIGKNYDKFVDIMKRSTREICAVYGISLVLCTYFSYISFNKIADVPFMNTIHYIYIVATIIFLYAVALRIPERIFNKIPLISAIDRASYNIYLWHMMVIFWANAIIEKNIIQSRSIAFAVRVAIVYPVTIGLCVLYGELKRVVLKRIINAEK